MGDHGWTGNTGLAGCGSSHAGVAVTGQKPCWTTTPPIETGACSGMGQDGQLRAGVMWAGFPNPYSNGPNRFIDNKTLAGLPDGTVTDTLTGLTWLKKA